MHDGQQLARVFSTSPSGALTTTLVDVAEFLESAVSLPAVRDDSATRLNVVRDEGVKRCAEASTSGAIRHRP